VPGALATPASRYLTLTARRLLTKGEGTVEVALEALLREWPRLRGWLEEDTHGLDGGPGRTFREIGQVLGRSPARARQLHWRAVTSIALAPGPRSDLEPHRRACGVAVHLATEVLGDPTDPQTPARMRASSTRPSPTCDRRSAPSC
jgi:hypothetical protein